MNQTEAHLINSLMYGGSGTVVHRASASHWRHTRSAGSRRKLLHMHQWADIMSVIMSVILYVWNSLPLHILHPPKHSSCSRHLKTH